MLSGHGFHLGEKGVWGKQTRWERSTHVPLVLRVPGRRGGVRREQVVELLDGYPTLVDLCGLELPGDFTPEGTSLAPLLDRSGTTEPRAAVTSVAPGSHAVRTRRWRYVRWEDGSEELYDRAADPGELTNLADDRAHDDARRELAAELPLEPAPRRPGAPSRDEPWPSPAREVRGW